MKELNRFTDDAESPGWETPMGKMITCKNLSEFD